MDYRYLKIRKSHYKKLIKSIFSLQITKKYFLNLIIFVLVENFKIIRNSFQKVNTKVISTNLHILKVFLFRLDIISICRRRKFKKIYFLTLNLFYYFLIINSL